MSCGSSQQSRSGNCVSRVLRDIVDAQNDVVEQSCITSCEKSISDLLGDHERNTFLDTVPIILYCKGTCKPFKGFGAKDDDCHSFIKSSFIFRVSEITRDNCAVLELLLPRHHKCHHDHDDDHDDDLEGTDVSDLFGSGICITVDLNCFCHVTCLPATRAIRIHRS